MSNYPIQGTVYNVSETAVNGFTITFSIADLTFTESFPTAIEVGENATFQLSETLSLPAAEITTYTCELESNGRLQYTVEGTVAYVPRKVVVEECTGSWCGYCVCGTVALEQLSAQYPESFIGIAVHNGDVLTVSEYDDAIGSNFRVSSYPTAVFNPPDSEPDEPNITTLHDFASKWQDMVESGEATLIEGAGYQSLGVYRGWPTCIMRALPDLVFCPVCTRALAKTIEYFTVDNAQK